MSRPPKPPLSRARLAELLCVALRECHDDDADQIVTAWVTDRTTHGPVQDLFGTIRQDAAFWAETAPRLELQAYAYAALKELGKSALGRSARLGLMAAMWNGMGEQDRAQFLRRVSGD